MIRTIALKIDSFIDYEISIKLEVINWLHRMKHKKHSTTSNQDYILSKVFCVWFNILDLHFYATFFQTWNKNLALDKRNSGSKFANNFLAWNGNKFKFHFKFFLLRLDYISKSYDIPHVSERSMLRASLNKQLYFTSN